MSDKEEITTFTMTEDQMKDFVRNTLMVAGQEMGEEGDHWPVIKNTINDIMKDWEEIDAKRAAEAEMKKHLYSQLHEMEEQLKSCKPEEQKKGAPHLAHIKELLDAYFTEAEQKIFITEDDLDDDEEDDDDETLPIHLKRAKAIAATLWKEKDDA